MTLIAITVALSRAAAPPAKKEKAASNDTMKGLVKDAVAPSPAGSADGGVAAARPGPDLEKLPFTPLSIQTVVTFYAPQIQGCYEETLAVKDKAVEGKLLTSFMITPEGLVKKPQVIKKGTTIKDPRLNDCVVAVLGTMAFPKPPDGKDHPIEYPFNLKAIE
jgi:hypothetical protein